jgi:hypothetical protein
MGQSNAAESGAGSYSDTLSVYDNKIKQLGRCGVDNLQVIDVGEYVDGVRWSGLQHWLHCSPSRIGFGAGLAFARQYAKNALPEGHLVLLVPSARGKSSILDWLGEISRFPESPFLYSDAIFRIRHSLSLPGTNHRFAGLIWSQGETDVVFSETGEFGMTTKNFRSKLQALFQQFRRDIPETLPYPFPIITSQFPQRWKIGDRTKASIQRSIAQISASEILSAITPTRGLSSNYDVGYGGTAQLIHFSAMANVTRGGRMFAVGRKLTDQFGSPWRK